MNPTVLFELKRLLKDFDVIIAEACEYGADVTESEAYPKIREDVLAKYSRETKNKTKEVYFFGSRTFGLAGKDSNLDIFVDIGKEASKIMFYANI